MAERDIPAEAREDLESGNWLFGRGVMDMKAGLALHMAYLCHMARHPEKLGVNLLFLAVPDEEGNSAGMRGALPGLCGFAREYGLDFAAAISGEPAFWTSRSEQPDGQGGDPYRIFFTGTTGKIMPMFFCVGREAHAGYSFDGVNAAALAAQTVCLMDCHPGLIDGTGADTLTPPVCLKMKDLRETYSVTLPERAVTYFNILTVSRSPREILDVCRDVAEKALAATLERINEAGRRFQQLSGRTSSPVPQWEARVFTVQELMTRARGRSADEFAVQLRGFLAGLPSTMDEREKGIAIVDWLVSLVNIKGPAIIVGFLPPYYPQRLNLRTTEKERRLRAIMEEICGELSSSVGNVKLVECFSGIMDLSFMGFQGDAQDLHSLAENMPGWGTLFSLPMDDFLSLDVPIANMGPSGKDAHKDTERLELDYSLDVAPRMLEKLIARLSEH
jgi:arginine utilization protein RocB